MAIIVMIYGQSGTGKSTSLRNFKPEDVCIVNVSGKPLPFRNKHKTFNTDDYMSIDTAIKKAPAKSIVIDDATYLMVNAFMRNAKVTGYQKYTDMAYDFDALINTAAHLPDDRIIYFIGHSTMDDTGREHFKTIGKMLDNYVTLEGKFTIVLKTVVQDGKYFFATRNNGQDTVKTPLGMFDEEFIDNDLSVVDAAIRTYYGI